MSTSPRILTTVVGSYPLPDWLAAAPSEQALVDATRVVLATQEQAGIDVVCDGELYRFDVNHPETNGMIEYFVRPLPGVRPDIGFDEWIAYRRARRCASAPGRRASSTGRSAAARSTCRSPARAPRARDASRSSSRSPARTCWRRRCSTGTTATRRSSRRRSPTCSPSRCAHLDADVVQVDEANLPGHPGRMAVGGGGDQQRARGGAKTARAAVHLCFGNYGGQSSRTAPGAADGLPERAQRRPHRHGVRAPAARGAGGVQGAAARDRLRPRRGRHQETEVETPTQIARAIERAEKLLGARPRQVHPSRLRLLDAEAHHRRRQDPRARRGATCTKGAPTERMRCRRRHSPTGSPNSGRRRCWPMPDQAPAPGREQWSFP